MSHERVLVLAVSLALACAAKTAVESDASEPRAEPVVFVEATPDPAQHAGTHRAAEVVSEGPSEQDRERAKVLYMEGAQRYESGDYQGALERFEQAYQLVGLPALRFNIARCHRQLGDTLTACAELADLLADPGVDASLRETAVQESNSLGC